MWSGGANAARARARRPCGGWRLQGGGNANGNCTPTVAAARGRAERVSERRGPERGAKGISCRNIAVSTKFSPYLWLCYRMIQRMHGHAHGLEAVRE